MGYGEVRLRILFAVDEKLKSFYWFECKGEDLYWGASGKISQISSSHFDGMSVTIKHSLSLEPIRSAKSSYHQSGEFHIKLSKEDGSSQYQSVMRWRETCSIDKPLRIMALVTKPPMHYDDYNRSLVRKGSRTGIIQFRDQSKTTRKYVEFFITPEGTFPFPELLIATPANISDVPRFVYPLSSRYTLLMWMLDFPMHHALNTWHPDVEMCFYMEDKEQTSADASIITL